MIKIITLITQFIIVTLVALFFGSCNNMNSISGSGNVTKEKRTVAGEFKSVEVSNALDLEIEQSDKTEIIVEADDNLQKDIETKVENGVLRISCKYSNFLNIKSKKVIVKMPIIEGLEASSASSINSNNTLKGEVLNISSSSAASIKVSAEYESMQLESSSGSNMTINGKAIKTETSASSGSIIDASKLLSNNVISDVSSGGSIQVHPLVSLKAEASSGGNINYNGKPKKVQKEERSGGSIHQDN
jgi:hypothetical protein